MLDHSFIKGDCPVRVIIPYRRWNEKTLGQFCVNNYFRAGVQFLDKGALCFRISNGIVIDMAFQRVSSLTEILFTLTIRKDVYIVGFSTRIIG